MSWRALVTLAVCTFVAAAVAIWTLAERQGTAAGLSARGELLFPALTAADAELEQVTVERADYTLVLRLKDGFWVASEYGDYPVPAEILNRLVSDLAALRLHELKTRRPEWYDRIGVEDPDVDGATSARIEMLGRGTVQADLIVGEQSRSIGADPAGGTFVRAADQTQAWLAQGSVTVPASLTSWFGPVLEIPAPRIRQISILENGELVLRAEKSGVEAQYRLTHADPRLGGDSARADDEDLKRLAGALVSIVPRDVRSAPDPQTDPARRSLAFETEDGLELTVTLLHLDGSVWATFEAAGTPGAAAESEAAEINRKAVGRRFLLEARRADLLSVRLTELVEETIDRDAAGQ